MNGFDFWLAPWSEVPRLLREGWRMSPYVDLRYAGWRVPMERPL